MKISLSNLLDEIDLHDAGISAIAVNGSDLAITFEPSEISCEEHEKPFGSEVCCRFSSVVVDQNEVLGNLEKISYEVLSTSTDGVEVVFQLQKHDLSTQQIEYCELKFTADPAIDVSWR